MEKNTVTVPKTLFSQVIHIFKYAAINLGLPFLNGVMLGFGEIFAHAFIHSLGWAPGHTRIYSIQRHQYIQA
ncbi:mitochondrial MIM complex subunit Mim1 [Schizosaccharomyces pombe]|uniref:Mitochondrial import protein 1 n=1 Tax=Schizosaccharomyces pombe (strain 972 / ATCC 24843) TaxID=284812 RepID=MIM1_SCHPO|nr:putative TOM complex assembly protein Mim1 [Schizosaccharomyces pombe]Q9C1W7.1 RecName: Full=Mitochondrial import protein 1 [Schizosaccharomyces pombe 972h-]CAC22609.1 mitochondrial TOM complex assembly protein Mim1 (predicted) [Schizosaccharomyces pombe]|eukprot:NP_595347.1 putative TOM complex assembly protein Mim1 [Schizosaccharomyces pombe]